MTKIVKRGYVPEDEIEFNERSVEKLIRAGADVHYLLNQGYPVKSATTFVGNHYLFSERQRLALARAVSSKESICARKEKELQEIPEGSTVHIDGFNTIISLEVALSGTLLLKCMDGTIRDLAALRGTYRLIDKTDIAILLVGRMLERLGAGKAVFYLDAPVSNSGRLKQRITELLGGYSFALQIEVIPGVDSVLEKLNHVITSDAIILDKCVSWINLNRRILEENMPEYSYVNFEVLNEG